MPSKTGPAARRLVWRDLDAVRRRGTVLKTSDAIDALCRRFKAEWREGKRPRLDAYLAYAPAELRAELRARLNALIGDLGKEAGDSETTAPARSTFGAARSSVDSSETADFTRDPRRIEQVETHSWTDPAADTGCESRTVETGGGHHVADELGSLLAALSPPREPGELGWLGPYRVLDVLGQGGMGVVFRAQDAQLHREIALKTMRPELAAAPANLSRFLREARATAALQHDHIVAIYHVGEERGVPFLAMPLLRGQTLEDRLGEKTRLILPEILRIGRESAEGLAEAHAHGLVHRDIKPRNMWLEAPRGRVKLLDFGLVRSGGDELGVTRTGMILGTPAYMSPEQAGGRTVDHRSDLFSLGCVLYRLATGRPPFQGSDPISTLVAVASAHPPLPCEVDPSVPPVLSLLIMKLLEKNPENRPASARAVADMLASMETARSGVAVAVLAAAPSPAAPPGNEAIAGTKLAPAPTPAPFPGSAPPRAQLATHARRTASGCMKAFVGCAVLTLVFVVLLVVGTALLLLKGVPAFINVVNEETKRQNDWSHVARTWKPPPADAGPDRLFPESVAGIGLDHHDTEIDLHYLGIDIAGQHGVYGQGAKAVEVFVLRANALEKEALFKRAIEWPKPGEAPKPGESNSKARNLRVMHGTPQDALLWYHMSPLEEYGVLWWDKGWLFVARSTSGEDPEPFLRQFVIGLGDDEEE